MINIPDNLRDKFDGLHMKPDDWTALHKAIGNDEDYRQAVLDYQARQWEAQPRCKDWFGVCSCYDHGRCMSKNYCRSWAF